MLLQRESVTIDPSPTIVYQTPGATGWVPQNPAMSLRAPVVVPVIVSPQLTEIALTQSSFGRIDGGASNTHISNVVVTGVPKYQS